MVRKSLLAVALLAVPFALAADKPSWAEEAAVHKVADAGNFTRQRTYFEPSTQAASEAGPTLASRDLNTLVRMLDRARDTRPVSANHLYRHYSLDAAVEEQAWRRRVSDELEALFK